METQFQKYKLGFNREVNFFGNMLKSRICLILNIKYNDLSACSDIPFYSYIDKDEINRYQDAISSFLSELDVDTDIREMFNQVNQLALSPAFAFGLNSGLLDLYLQKQNVKYDLSQVHSYKFYQISTDLSKQKTIELMNSGESSVKVKYSGEAEERWHINRLNLNPGIKFRIDMNRKFDYQEAYEEIRWIVPEAIEYIEEPCSELNRLEDLIRHSNVPIALDETIINREMTDKLRQLAQYYIIKPTLIGDFAYISGIIDYARSNHKKVIISSAYENRIGIRSLKQLICYFGLQNNPMGLDTEKLIERTIIEE